MFKKIKESFNPAASAAKKSWRRISAFAAAFFLATTASARPNDEAPPPFVPAPPTQSRDVSYWKMDDYDVVLKTWHCAERGFCGEIYSYDANDPKVRELIAQVINKSKKVEGPFGITYYTYAPENLRPDEIRNFCGFPGNFDMKKQEDGAWEGTIFSFYHGQSYDLRLEEGDSALKATAYPLGVRLFSVSLTATKLNQPPPSCG